MGVGSFFESLLGYDNNSKKTRKSGARNKRNNQNTPNRNSIFRTRRVGREEKPSMTWRERMLSMQQNTRGNFPQSRRNRIKWPEPPKALENRIKESIMNGSETAAAMKAAAAEAREKAEARDAAVKAEAEIQRQKRKAEEQLKSNVEKAGNTARGRLERRMQALAGWAANVRRVEVSTEGEGQAAAARKNRGSANKYLSTDKLRLLRGHRGLDPDRGTGENHPKTAFVMMGHGGENPALNVVPKGCVLVVQVHSGELNYLPPDTFMNIFNDNRKDLLLDPVANYKYVDTLINKSKRESGLSPIHIAIYREGDVYPDFFYSILSKWDSNDNPSSQLPKNSYRLSDSGIAQFPFQKGSSKYIEEDHGYNEYGKDKFLNLFNKSIYPPINKLTQLVENAGPTMKDIITNVNINDILTVTQKDLFNMLGPGVYYNLVCRETFTEGIRTINTNTGREKINNTRRALVNEKGHINFKKRELLQQIIESKQRSPYIAQLGLNKEDDANTRRNLRSAKNAGLAATGQSPRNKLLTLATRANKIAEARKGLPDGWKVDINSSGEIYYVDEEGFPQHNRPVKASKKRKGFFSSMFGLGGGVV